MTQDKDHHHEQVNALSPDAKATGETPHKVLKEAEISYDWFTKEGHYAPSTGIEVKRLVCGEEAFAAIHEAIDKAKSSVDILIWGFDPMMRFNPNKSEETIGELLERKGKAGIKCRLMVWYDNVAKFNEPTLIGDTTTMNHVMLGMQTTGTEGYYYISEQEQDKMNENSLIARQKKRNELLQQKEQKLIEIEELKQKTPPSVKDQKSVVAKEKELAKIDQKLTAVEDSLTGYESPIPTGSTSGPRQHPQDSKKSVAWISRLKRGQITNVQYKARNFKNSTTSNIVKTVVKNHQETNTNPYMRRILGNFTSHHQKLILIDYEQPNTASCTAFVMGHNMHRAYWDTKAHYFYAEDANRVQGFGPWQDISTQVWGEILWDINENFVTAWELIKPIDNLRQQRQSITKQNFKAKGSKQVMFCRTMPQVQLASTGCYERSILATYKKAIKNSYNYIYMENQYFRYQDIAKKVKQQAFDLKQRYKKLNAKNKAPLYLFVLTNTTKEGNYSSTTYAMFKELGQQQLLPEAQRTLYLDQIAGKVKIEELARRGGIENYTFSIDDKISQKDQQHIEPVKTKEDVAKMSQEGQGWDIDGIDGKKPFELEDIDGLKIIIGTLTSDNSITSNNPRYSQGHPNAVHESKTNFLQYREIYIHSKLLVVDDLFTLVSSANINTRSFWVDSESGIAIPDPSFAKGMRDELWLMHTKQSYNGGDQTASAAINCDSQKNYEHWNEQMNANWKHKAKGEPLECHLTRFWEAEMPYATAAD